MALSMLSKIQAVKAAMINNTDDVLYSSTKADQPEENVPVVFTPENDPEYLMKESIKPPEPVYARTIIPEKVRIIPDVAFVQAEEAIKVDPMKMTKYFSEPVCRQIIDDMKNKRSLMPKIAEILVRKNIVQASTLSETLPTKEQIILPSNRISKVKKSGLLNKTVNFIYKLLYK